jgi:DNA-directed RNA polymerase specialized sigma24 family protein
MSNDTRQVCDNTERVASGDETAREQLFEQVHDELKRIAHGHLRRERSEHSWQTTELVNEAVLKLLPSGALAQPQTRAYFFAAVARAMRQLLIDHAR